MIIFGIDGALAGHRSAGRVAAVAFQREHAPVFPESPVPADFITISSPDELSDVIRSPSSRIHT